MRNEAVNLPLLKKIWKEWWWEEKHYAEAKKLSSMDFVPILDTPDMFENQILHYIRVNVLKFPISWQLNGY